MHAECAKYMRTADLLAFGSTTRHLRSISKKEMELSLSKGLENAFGDVDTVLGILKVRGKAI